jgi:MATE family multidrug resistance protein
MFAPPLAARLIRLAGPVALARLGIMGMGIADTIMVGQMAPEELPYQALGWAPTAVFLVGGIGLLTGVQVLAARVIGQGRPDMAGIVLRRGLMLALIVGLAASLALAFGTEPLLRTLGVEARLVEPAARVAAVLGVSIPLHLAFVAGSYFLEAVGRPGVGATIMWSANLLNIAVNAALIPTLGAEGSAWATVASRVFLAGALLGWIYFRFAGAAFGVRSRPDAAAPSYRALLTVGIAAAVSQIAEAGAFGGMTIIAGRISAADVAAYQIIINIMALVFMLALGVATATQVLVSEAIGARDKATASNAGWMGLGLIVAVMTVIGVVFSLAGGPIARGFSADAALVALVAAALPIAALALPPDGGQVVAAAALRGRGDNWFPTASHVLCYVAIMPPLGWWLAEHGGRGVGGLIEAIAWASLVSVSVLAARLWFLARPTA